MKEVKARDILGIDTISKGNEKPWIKLSQYLDENPDEDIEFDFAGINVAQPGSSIAFNKIISRPNFHMVLHDSKPTEDTIKAICILNNIDASKVRNIDTVVPKQLTAEEKNRNRMIDQLIPYISINGDTAIFEPYHRFDQIGQPNTLKYIELTIIKHSEQTGCKNYIVDFNNVNIQVSIINIIADSAYELEKQGINVEFKSNDKELQNKIDMKLDLGRSNYTMADRFRIMQARLVPGRVGILTKYKEGRAKDEFGRIGHGEVVSIRIAVFVKFFTDMDGNTMVKFHSYNSDYLYTKEHWSLEHDGDELRNLIYDEVNAKVEDVGIYNDFIGSRFHFASAVQYSPNGSMIMYHLEPVTETKSTVVGVEYTIPERVKAVFDDFGVEYEEASLNAYIKSTREILNEISE